MARKQSSKVLNKSLIKTWKEYATAVNLYSLDCLHKLSDFVKRSLEKAIRKPLLMKFISRLDLNSLKGMWETPYKKILCSELFGQQTLYITKNTPTPL